MERTLYGFYYDYVRQRGTCLVLSGMQPIPYDDLGRIERRMMESNEIPGLLPLEIEEIDMQIRLRYNITGYKMLSQWMKTEKLMLPTYYRLLLQCAKIIDDSKTYMLREDGYWLHEDFLFVRPESPDELSMVYVPVSPAAGPTDSKPPVRDQFRELALRLSGCIDTIEGSEFSALMSVLRRERFEFHDLKKQLSSYIDPVLKARGDEQPLPLLNPDTYQERSRTLYDRSAFEGADGQRKKEAEAGARAGSVAGAAAAPLNIPSWIGVGSGTVPKDRSSSYSSSIGGHEGKVDEELAKPDSWSQLTDGTGTVKPVTPRQKFLSGAGAGALLLLLWSFYPAEAPEGAMIVWAGLTVLLLDAVFVFALLRPGWPGKEKLQAIAQSYHAMEEREMTGLTGYLPPNKKGENQQLRGGNSVPADHGYSGIQNPEPSAPFPSLLARQEAAGSVAEPTTLLRPTDATVLLRPERSQLHEEMAADPIRYSELEVHKAGAVQRLPLKSERFVIGRDPGAVDYTEDTAGVSKLHAEIVCERSSYYAKDLGSKNGTLWNNEPMVPYKWYPLAEGDALQIVHTRFIFVGKPANSASHP